MLPRAWTFALAVVSIAAIFAYGLYKIGVSWAGSPVVLFALMAMMMLCLVGLNLSFKKNKQAYLDNWLKNFKGPIGYAIIFGGLFLMTAGYGMGKLMPGVAWLVSPFP